MKAWRKGSGRSGGDRSDMEELPIWTPRPPERWWEVVLGFVGCGLVFFGVASIVLPVEDDRDVSCGIAPSVVVVLGVDTADAGDEEWCRSASRDSVVGGLTLAVPGVLLVGWLVWRIGPVDASAPPGSPDDDDSTSRAPPRDGQPPDGTDSRLPTPDADPPTSQ